MFILLIIKIENDEKKHIFSDFCSYSNPVDRHGWKWSHSSTIRYKTYLGLPNWCKIFYVGTPHDGEHLWGKVWQSSFCESDGDALNFNFLNLTRLPPFHKMLLEQKQREIKTVQIMKKLSGEKVSICCIPGSTWSLQTVFAACACKQPVHYRSRRR